MPNKIITTEALAEYNRKLNEKLQDKLDTLKSHTHASLDNSADDRSANTKPQDYYSKLKVAGLKYDNAIGLNSNQSYSTIVGING